MADGTRKPISAIVIGDEVAAFNGLGALAPGKVVSLRKVRRGNLVCVNHATVCSDNHRFLTPDGEFREIGRLRAGDSLVDASGKPMLLISVDRLSSQADVFNFEVERFHTYVAGDARVHNWKRYGGYIRPDADRVLEARRILAHEGEYVLRPEATAKYGRKFLGLLNKGAISKRAVRGLLA